MSKKELGKMVDEYGELNAKSKIIATRMKELKKDLKLELSIGEALTGTAYVVSLTERIATVLNPKKVLKMVGDKKFLDCIKVQNSLVGKYLSKEDMDRCTLERSVTETLSSKAIK